MRSIRELDTVELIIDAQGLLDSIRGANRVIDAGTLRALQQSGNYVVGLFDDSEGEDRMVGASIAFFGEPGKRLAARRQRAARIDRAALRRPVDAESLRTSADQRMVDRYPAQIELRDQPEPGSAAGLGHRGRHERRACQQAAVAFPHQPVEAEFPGKLEQVPKPAFLGRRACGNQA